MASTTPRSHGQSLDWILLGEPGCMICGGASNSDRARSNAHNDSVLLALEEQIFEVREAAHAHDEEIFRLCEVWRSEIHRLHNEICAGRLELTYREAWDRVSEMPESKEHDRLVGLGEPHHAKKDQLIEEMWATPALTSEGRRSKVLVLLGCIMGQNDDDGWQEHDGSYLISPEAELARKLLIEFVGGEPGESLRDQFRASAA